ncbi:ABC transporter substrate-binding protein [Brevibacterium sp. 50QC2O2]|uniref:ABC transporter substrate-binding protein n=1 Tax=Brevibacterium TaxID=1696 RepID=UPI00211B8F3E|nr:MULTISPECIES: ABC transporter substrate-binding protein [unclassified Brevibacterium]MCQ9386333.1 ABC transporter substrate-binding protein [Brevibacterium sp. 68QC2CO]MCQ9389468.1 ABC transporter substrate-binding protein [Brevibacterium sp. 50QC2O2]
MKKSTRTGLSLTSLVAAAALLLTGCNANDLSGDSDAGQDLGETQSGGNLTIMQGATDIEWDPAKSQNLAITTLGLVERRLTTWDAEPGKETKVVPDLAKDTGTPSKDGKTWTFKLKDGLKYEDGSTITAQDIKYGLERSFSTELSGGLGYHKSLLVGGDDYRGPYSGKHLDSIKTPDDKTIVFTLKSAFGDFPWIASMPAFAPVPKAKDDIKAYTKKPVASGPYRVAKYTAGNQAVLERNEHWDKDTDPVRTAGPDTVTFKLGQDITVSAQSLISDSGDAKNGFSADFVPASQLAQAQQNPAAKDRLVTSGDGALAYLAMNTKRGALKDLKVRQAINYAVDKNAFRVAAGGEIAGDFASTLITPGIPGRADYDLYQADAAGDVDKAKSLLAESGQKPGKLRLLVKNDQTNVAQAESIQQSLGRAGIEVSIKSEDQQSLQADATDAKGDYDLYLGSWQPDFPSANGNIQPLFDSSQIGGGNYNISRYSNKKVDALIKQATEEVDRTKAGQVWAQADKLIMEDAPIVPLIYTKNTFIHGSGVENFVIGKFPAYPVYFKASLKQG